VLDQLVVGPIALHDATLLLLLLLGLRPLALVAARRDREVARNRAAVYHFEERAKGEEKDSESIGQQ